MKPDSPSPTLNIELTVHKVRVQVVRTLNGKFDEAARFYFMQLFYDESQYSRRIHELHRAIHDKL